MIMKAKRFLSVPLLAVLLLMVFVYYTTIVVFIDDWVGLQSSPGTLNAIIFTLLASLCLFSFFVCVLTDPGRVPSSYVPDVEGHEFSKDVSFFSFFGYPFGWNGQFANWGFHLMVFLCWVCGVESDWCLECLKFVPFLCCFGK